MSLFVLYPRGGGGGEIESWLFEQQRANSGRNVLSVSRPP